MLADEARRKRLRAVLERARHFRFGELVLLFTVGGAEERELRA